MKKIISILIVALMLVSLLPTMAFATRETSLDNSSMLESPSLIEALGEPESGGCTHEGYVAWDSNNSLPTTSGNYYLNKDVTLARDQGKIPAGSEDNPTTINLCLNGHYIKEGVLGYIRVNKNAILNIYDEEDAETSYKFTVDDSGRWKHAGTWSNEDEESEIVKKVTGGFIQGYSDYNIISVYAGGKLNIYGGTYTGAVTANGAVNIQSQGTFIMYGGTICRNVNPSQVGGGVRNHGTFELRGGSICDNIASASMGGGVYNDGTFKMYGGTIERNRAEANTGGGVYTAGVTFTMKGGSICDNTTSDKGGGVYYEWSGNFILGGSAVIRGNKVIQPGSSEPGTECNVQLGSNKFITVDTEDLAPCDGMSIGITGNVGKFSTSGSSDDVKYFTSDKSDLYVDVDNNTLVLKSFTGSNKYAVTVSKADNGLVYTNKHAAASEETVTLTAHANDGYMLDSISVNGGAVSLNQENDTTYTFTMPNEQATVSAEFVTAGPSIKVTKVLNVENPVYGEAKTAYELFSVTTPNFSATPTLTLQWQHIGEGDVETWETESPATGLSMTTDGKVTTTADTPAGDYIFRITNSEPETIKDEDMESLTYNEMIPNPAFIASTPTTLTVEKADPAIGDVSATDTIYNTDSLSEVAGKLSCTGSVEGTFTLEEGSTLEVGPGDYNYTFTPSSNNYNSVSGTVSLIVVEDTLQSISIGDTTPTKTEYEYGDSFDKSGLTVTGTYLSTKTKNVTDSVTFTPETFTIIDTDGNTSVTLSYEGKTCSVTGLKVNKKTNPTVNAPTGAEGLIYTGENQNLCSAGSIDGTPIDSTNLEYTLGNDNSTPPESGWSSNIPVAKESGTYYVWYRWNATGYVGVAATFAAEVQISKIDYENVGKTASGALMVTSGSTVEVQLPSIPESTTYGQPTVQENFRGNVNAEIIDSSKLNLTVTTEIPAGATDFTITVPVNPDANHNAYDIVVTITPVYRTVVTINATADNYTYGTNGKGYTGLSVTGGDVSTDTLVFMYESTGETPLYSSENAPTDAGTYKVTISVPASNTTYVGSSTVNFEVDRKQVTVTANNITVYIGESIPALDSSDYTVSGLVNSDELTGITLKYETTPDTDSVGTYTILVVDDQNNSRRNYDVTGVNGTLTVVKRSSGGGGGSVTTNYTVTAKSTKNGTITVDKTKAASGSTVTITAKPAKGFTVETITVLDKKGNEVAVKNLGNNKFSFTMPKSDVTVSATFMEDNTMLNFFVDVKANDYFYDAVLWAAENNIATGVDSVHFDPLGSTTRAQMVTFIWRLAGSPDFEGGETPFTDIKKSDYFYDAVVWGWNVGIINGKTDTLFAPDDIVTRGEAVTFIYRYAKVAGGDLPNPFTDVVLGKFYYYPVLWAANNEIVKGTSTTTFSPDAECTRGQVVTFLYRYNNAYSVQY